MIVSAIIAVFLVWCAYRIGYYNGTEYALREVRKIMEECKGELEKCQNTLKN